MFSFIKSYLLEIFLGIIVALFTYLFKRIISYKKSLDNVNSGVMIILKIKITEMYNNFINNDYISFYDKENILDLYNVYKRLGGNSFIDDLIKKINQLRVVD